MNYLVNYICLIVLLVLMIWISMDMMMSYKKKIGMNVCVSFTFVCIFSLILCQIFENNDVSFIPLSIISNMIGFVLSPFIFMIEAHAFLGEMKRKYLIYFIPAFINALCALASPMTKWIFYISDNNEYFRGEYYFIYLFAFMFSVFYSLGRKMNIVSRLPSYFYKRILFSSFAILPLLFTQIIFPDIQISYLIITIHLLLYYGLSSQIVSLTDGLTGLLNRGAFDNFVKNLKINENEKYAIIVADVDDFKKLNDDHGHIYGDEYLKLIADVLKDVFNRRIFRIGGDEFIILLKLSDDYIITDNLNRLDSKLEEIRKEKTDFPTLSYGYDVYELGMNIQSVLNNADLRMYKHKNSKIS